MVYYIMTELIETRKENTLVFNKTNWGNTD